MWGMKTTSEHRAPFYTPIEMGEMCRLNFTQTWKMERERSNLVAVEGGPIQNGHGRRAKMNRSRVTLTLGPNLNSTFKFSTSPQPFSAALESPVGLKPSGWLETGQMQGLSWRNWTLRYRTFTGRKEFFKFHAVSMAPFTCSAILSLADCNLPWL